jgi:Icc-related predicted phosphoesterase
MSPEKFTKTVSSPQTRFMDAMQLVLLSDTHELHREVEVPDGDVLIHAGDLTMFSKSLRAIEDFNDWLGELPHPHKIVVPGNHEFFLEADPARRSLLSNATLLVNEGIEIEGLRLWGSPVTTLYGGAFGMSSAEDRRRLYAQIPESTDVLITHGPPHGILDSASASAFHSGCRELFDAVMRVRPKLHVFGHIHGAHGIFETCDTTFVNSALMGTHGDLDRGPIVLQMTRK